MNRRTAFLLSGLLLSGLTRAHAVMPLLQDDSHWKNVRQVSVQGHGKMSATPDQATLWVEVSEEGPKLEDVTSRVRTKIDAVLKAIKSQGIADKDIQTQSYQVNPQMSWDGGKSRRSGYAASNRVKVTIHDLKKTGSLISSVEDAGANTISGPQYGFQNPQTLERKALQLAMDDAKAKADLLAQSAGATLGETLDIQEGGISMPTFPRPFASRAMASPMASAPEPIAEGEQSVEASVTVVYALH